MSGGEDGGGGGGGEQPQEDGAHQGGLLPGAKVRDFVKVFIFCPSNRGCAVAFPQPLSLSFSLAAATAEKEPKKERKEKKEAKLPKEEEERKKKKKSKNDDGEGGGHGQHLRGLHTRVVNLAIILRLEGTCLPTTACQECLKRYEGIPWTSWGWRASPDGFGCPPVILAFVPRSQPSGDFGAPSGGTH